MKKFLSILCAVAMTTAATGCTGISGMSENDPAEILTQAITGEITVACYDTMIEKSFLENAATAFEAKYPGTKINIEAFGQAPEMKTMEVEGGQISVVSMGDDTQTKNDYISKVNTELMSGRGADILSMDTLPYYRYAENRQLENLQAYMDADPDFNPADYQQNILDALRYENGLYMMPLDYYFNYFTYDTTLFTEEEQKLFGDEAAFTYDELIALAQTAYNRENAASDAAISMFPLPPSSLFDSLFASRYSQFIDIPNRKADLDSGAFAALLHLIKDYETAGYIPNQQSMAGGAVFSSSVALSAQPIGGNPESESSESENTEGINAADDENESSSMFSSEITEGLGLESDIFDLSSQQSFFKPQNSLALLQMFNTNPNQMIFSTSGMNTENDAIAGLQKDEQGNYPFYCNQMYGINANSANKRLAWEFIKFLVGEETLMTPMMAGLPINNNALEGKTKLNIQGSLFDPRTNQFNTDAAGVSLNAEQQAIYDNYLSLLQRYINKLNTFNIQDDTIQSLIRTEIDAFFSGSKTIDAVTAELNSRLSLYLGE